MRSDLRTSVIDLLTNTAAFHSLQSSTLPMSSLSFVRLVSRTQPSSLLRSQITSGRLPLQGGAPVVGCVRAFSTSLKRPADGGHHSEETFEEFTARYAWFARQPSQLIKQRSSGDSIRRGPGDSIG